MGVKATAGTAVRLRVITLRLPTGQIETLVTTLTEEKMPEAAFGEWYALRWGIEVHDGQEQYALEMENFSGPPARERTRRPCDDSVREFERCGQARSRTARGRSSRSVSAKVRAISNPLSWWIATLKYRMIPWLWAKPPVDFERQPRRFQRTIVRLMRDIVPVIPGIITPRNKKRGRTNKFVITLRRSLSRRNRAGLNPNPRALTTTFEKIRTFRRVASCWSNGAIGY